MFSGVPSFRQQESSYGKAFLVCGFKTAWPECKTILVAAKAIENKGCQRSSVG